MLLRILITGVDGFVGRYLAKYLQEINGLSVWGTTRQTKPPLMSNRNIKCMDIVVKSQIKSVLEQIKPNYIFHFAAQSSVSVSWENPQHTISVNVNGTLNLLDCVKEMNLQTRVLLVGSCEEYGSVDLKRQPIDESQSLHPINPYALSKTAQHMAATLYIKNYGMDIVTVRSFNQIGAGQDPKFAISYFAKRIAEIESNLKDNILEVGNLEPTRDFLDIRDAVRVYWLIMQKGIAGEIYNVGSGEGHKIQDVLQKLLSLSKIHINVQSDLDRFRPTEVPISICNNNKIKSLLNWKPMISLEDSLEDILNYWRKIIKEEGGKNFHANSNKSL